MKRIYTLLVLMLSAFTLKTIAQPGTNPCNPAFDVTVSGMSAHFTPAITGDPGVTTHTWSFGDGTSSNAVSPTHQYSSCGIYTVKHKITRSQTITAAPCKDSTYKTITIACPTVCNIHAKFVWHADPANSKKINFQNQSTPANDIHSSKWTFGDGTYSYDYNASHVYTSAGTYTVCLTVKKQTNTGVLCTDDTCMTVVVSNPPPPPPCNLVANFTYTSTTTQPNKIYFTNTSGPAVNINYVRWTFGDGTSSNDYNASHTYTNGGTYTVCLVVKILTSSGAVQCVAEICKSVVVHIPPPPPCIINASFTYTSTASQPNKIYFSNKSTPTAHINSTKWTFGDGTTSNDFNAVHTYTHAGTYTVCLIVAKLSPNGAVVCKDDTCAVITVTVPPVLCNLVANFQWVRDQAQANKIIFTNLSYPLSPTDSIRWTFGDGSTATSTNAVHTYNTPGTYHVCLRIKKNNTIGSAPCVKEICKDVVVYAHCNLVASFTSQANPQNSLQVNFNNTSTPASAATGVTWTFGDGTSSNQWSPIHTYTHGGTYTVCLRIVSGINCVREICKTVVVTQPVNCLEISKFETIRSTVNCLEYKFEPIHKNTTWQYYWTFGDGTSSTQMSPVHVYAVPGNYNVCLTVIRSSTCASTTCKTISTGLCFSCHNVWAKYSYVRDPANSNKLYFHAFSNYNIQSQSWTITRILPASTTPPVVLNQVDPAYTFPTPGYYRVCLRAVTTGGCIKEYCEVIQIGQLNTPCTLSAYPNPATSQISVNVLLTSPEIIHGYIYNSLNILVKEKHQPGNTGNNVVIFNLNGLVAGTYTIKLIYGNKVCYAQFQKL